MRMLCEFFAVVFVVAVVVGDLVVAKVLYCGCCDR